MDKELSQEIDEIKDHVNKVSERVQKLASSAGIDAMENASDLKKKVRKSADSAVDYAKKNPVAAAGFVAGVLGVMAAIVAGRKRK